MVTQASVASMTNEIDDLILMEYSRKINSDSDWGKTNFPRNVYFGNTKQAVHMRTRPEIVTVIAPLMIELIFSRCQIPPMPMETNLKPNKKTMSSASLRGRQKIYNCS